MPRSRIPSLLFVTLAISFGYPSMPVSAGQRTGTLDIYWIDVEGGAATLIVTPQGESVLIDTGNPGTRDSNRITKLLHNTAKLTRIDHLITTHYHRDHYGGAMTLATQVPIGAIYDNGVFADMPDNPGKAYFDIKCDRRVVIQPGQQIPLRQDDKESGLPLKLTCLAARQQFIASPANVPRNPDCASGKSKERDGSDNANSIAVLLEFGAFRFFDGGDLTWNQEAKLVCPVNRVGVVDVYQVTHHGLDSSNNPLVLKALQPRVAVMNNGATKGCKPEVFANLKQTPCLKAIFQVHKNLRPDGSVNNVPDRFIANHSKECQGHPIHLSVMPDGQKYSVAIPAHDVVENYVTQDK